MGRGGNHICALRFAPTILTRYALDSVYSTAGGAGAGCLEITVPYMYRRYLYFGKLALLRLLWFCMLVFHALTTKAHATAMVVLDSN